MKAFFLDHYTAIVLVSVVVYIIFRFVSGAYDKKDDGNK